MADPGRRGVMQGSVWGVTHTQSNAEWEKQDTMLSVLN